MLEFFICGVPVPQGRPRFGRGHAYDPEDSKAYKERVRLMVKSSMQGRKPLDGSLWLSLVFYVPIPKNISQKQRGIAVTGKLRPAKKPDLSNYLKSIEDALNGVLWTDDSRIVEYRPPFGKWYSEQPGIWLRCGTVDYPMHMECPYTQNNGLILD